MHDTRPLFLAAARTARDLVLDPAVEAAWHEQSALAEFSVRGLSGHLAGRAIGVVLECLDAPEPDAPPIDAAEYYLTVLSPDPLDESNRPVREGGEALAAGGPAALAADADRLLEVLSTRLAAEPRGRRLTVFGGLVMTLDEYLVTRLTELLVHTDDLAVSVGVPTPSPDPAAVELVTSCLLAMARRRHGDTAVLRAFARGERDTAHALRVI